MLIDVCHELYDHMTCLQGVTGKDQLQQLADFKGLDDAQVCGDLYALSRVNCSSDSLSSPAGRGPAVQQTGEAAKKAACCYPEESAPPCSWQERSEAGAP